MNEWLRPGKFVNFMEILTIDIRIIVIIIAIIINHNYKFSMFY